MPELWAQTSFAKGEELFMQNKPQEALAFLESTVSEDPAHVQAFLYLGIVYLQLNRVDDAIAVYRRILPRGGAETARIAYNLGNAYFAKGDFASAKQYYTQAIEENPNYGSAFLNRANAQVRNGDLNDAITDYEIYLSIEPGTPQRGQIERLIAFIREEFVETERRRIQAEEAAKAAELARIQAEEEARIEAEVARIFAEEEAERARIQAEEEAERIRILAEEEAERIRILAEEAARAEAERRRQLLQEVADSLQAAAEGSKGLSAGSEDVQDYDNEFVLE